jgi:hypothetical protein
MTTTCPYNREIATSLCCASVPRNDVSWVSWKRSPQSRGAFGCWGALFFVSFLLGMQKKRKEDEQRTTAKSFVFSNIWQQYEITTKHNNFTMLHFTTQPYQNKPFKPLNDAQTKLLAK